MIAKIDSRPIDDAKIRACAIEAKIVAGCLKEKARRLKELFDQVYDELQFADPVADRDFERYMLVLARANGELQSLDAVIHMAGEMESFRKPAAALHSLGDGGPLVSKTVEATVPVASVIRSPAHA